MKHWTGAASKLSGNFKDRRAKIVEERSQKHMEKSKNGAPPLSRYRFALFMVWAIVFGTLVGVFVDPFWLFAAILVPALFVAGYLGYASEREERRALQLNESLKDAREVMDQLERDNIYMKSRQLTQSDRRMIRDCANSIEMQFWGFAGSLREIADKSENGDA